MFPEYYYINRKKEKLFYPCLPEQAYESFCPVPIKKFFGEGRFFTIINEKNEIWTIYLNENNEWVVMEFIL